jgi:hypothetical protein
MNDYTITLLLNLVNKKGNILRLRREHLSFKQIVELTDDAVARGLIAYSDKKIGLTEKGVTMLAENEHLIKKMNKAEWIELDIKNKTKPFPKNEVFLPSRNELSF